MLIYKTNYEHLLLKRLILKFMNKFQAKNKIYQFIYNKIIVPIMYELNLRRYIKLDKNYDSSKK